MSSERVLLLGGIIKSLVTRATYAGLVFASAIAAYAFFVLIAPGWVFLQSAPSVTVTDTRVGADVPFDWCRSPRFGTIQATAIRSFYIKNSDGRFVPLRDRGDYTFKPNIEPIDKPCQPLTIRAERQPDMEGTYYFVTDLVWQEGGHEKKLRYTSSQYRVYATAASLRARITELESEKAALEQRVLQLEDRTSAAPTTSPTPTQESTSRATLPTTSAPPEATQPTPQPQPEQPPQPQQPPQRGLVQSVIEGVDGLLESVL